MRLYIAALKHEPNKGTINYTLASAQPASMSWPTIAISTVLKDQINRSGGITVTSPLGKSSLCTNFHVEPRPHGGFAVFCEYS